jgi:hypothetical protein
MAIRDTALFRPWYLPYPATRFLSITRRGISIWHQQTIPVATSEVDKFLFKSAARQGQATWNCGQIALTLATIPVPDIKETCGLTFLGLLPIPFGHVCRYNLGLSFTITSSLFF